MCVCVYLCLMGNFFKKRGKNLFSVFEIGECDFKYYIKVLKIYINR